MTEVKTQPVTAQSVDDIDSDAGQQPGAFEIVIYGDSRPEKKGQPAGMVYRCPCGCGREGYLAFRPHSSPSWNWNGSTEKPTLTPSVHHIGHWHGWLTDGVWRSC